MDFTNCKYPRHQLIINEVANSSPGPDRVTFLITTIIYTSSPPLFLAPRFWGATWPAATRVLSRSKRKNPWNEVAKRRRHWEQQKRKQNNNSNRSNYVENVVCFHQKICWLCFCSLSFSLPLIFTLLQSRVVQTWGRITQG